MIRRSSSHSLINLVSALALLSNLLMPLAPAAAAPPAPTFTPPVESGFQGATQATVAGPMGLDVSIYDLSLRAVRTDFFIPGCVVPLQATFIFEQDFGNSPFGYGWRFVYGAGYTEQGDGSLIIGPINGQMARFTPGDGHLFRPQPGRYQLHLDNGDTYLFDDPGHKQVTKIEAVGGGHLVLDYDAAGKPIRITDHYGRHLDFSYANGKLTGITDANASPARTTSYAYDANGNLSSVTDPLGNVTRYAFDATHQLRRITDPGGNWADITYVRELSIPTEFPDGVADITTPLGAVSFQRKIVYKIPVSVQPLQSEAAAGQTAGPDRQIIANFASVTDVVNGQQRTTRYDFSIWDGQLRQITDPLGAVTIFCRDAQGNLRQLTNENGDITTTVYNGAGQLMQITDPLARVTKYSYDANGQIASVTDPLNQTTQYQYDSSGNLIGMTDPLGNITSYSYDANGKLLTVTDPLSNTLSYTYDAFGFPASVRDGAGVTATLTYNARGDLLQITDGRNQTTGYGRDSLGRTITITNPSGETTRLAYDANGNLAQLFDPAGRIVNYTYDLAGRPVKLADALGEVKYTYDAAGNITAISDGLGNQDSFTYDLNGRLTVRSDGLNRATAFTYDPAGNLIRRTDPLTQTTVYTYDAANQLAGINYPDGSVASYSYDANGNLLQETNANVTVTYAYDANNRLTGASADGKTTSYSYDAAGRRASMTDPDGNITSYTYDGGGRLLTVNDSLAGTTGYTYSAAGKLSRLDRANGVYSLYTYDVANRLQTITHYAPGGALLDSFTYTYDKAGNRSSVTSAQSGTTSYTYDGRYQLTGVTYPDGSTTTYGYDLAGNRLTENGAAYQYDAAAQLLSAGTTTYGWDGRGNQLGEAGNGLDTSYHYDHENRLTGGSFADNTSVSYAYYPDGRLYSRTDRAGTTTRFYYDGPNLLLETDGGGSTQARYTNGLNLDAWLAMQTDGQNYAFLHDGLNSVTGVTDGGGTLTASYQYDAYGGIRAQTGSVPNPFLFTGRYWDADAGLYQYRARWYDPGNGRFLSRDPLGPINVRQMYAYVNNNPATYVDPLGLDTWSCSIKKLSLGFLVGGELSRSTCQNQETDEECTLHTFCIKLGAVAGASANRCEGYQFNGPRKGGALGGGEFSAFAEASVGIGAVGIGGEANINTENFQQGSLNGCKGLGIGADVGVGGQYCRTNVISCTRPPEPDPPPVRPPQPPGQDNADDNYSAAGRVLPASNYQVSIASQTSLSQSPGSASLPLVGQPRVGIFWHGYAEEAQALLASWGWASTPVDIDFAPSALDLPVLFIPSGGLFGLDSAPSVRARLETFAANGGVIISLAQQHGYEFASLPGGQLKGYGWAEDSSCFDASLYVSQYHPLLSGFSRATLTAGVDGFFSSLPAGAQTLLNRSRDGRPGLALYPYQSGWVVAASVYDDWGGSNHQPPADSARLLRDLLSWGMDAGGPLPEFSPAMTATVPITIVNASLLDTARVRFQVVNPGGQAVVTQTLDLPLLPGDQSLRTIQHPNLPADLGIWWVQYTLLDAGDNVIQPAVWGGRFAVSDPHPAAGPGKEMALSITAPTEDFVPGAATFTFHVHNFTNSSRPATVAFGFPHHTWETGDPAYGDFYGLSQSVDVPPQSEITFTHTAEIVTNDRLFARLYDATFNQNAWFQIRKAAAAVNIDLGMDADIYRRGQTAAVTVTLRNLQSAAHQVTLNLKTKDSQGGVLYQSQQAVALTAAAIVTTPMTFTVPLTAQSGTGALVVTAQDAGGNNLNAAHDHFTIPDSPLAFTATLPANLSPGATENLTVTVTNNSASLNVLTATLAVTITNPDSSFQTLPVQPFSLAAGQGMTKTIPFTVPPAQFGEYTFDFKSADEYGQHVWTVIDRNEPVISSRFGQSAYASGDLVHMEVSVQNSGRWSQSLDLLIAPLVSAAITIPVAIDAGEAASITVDIPLPTGMTAGSYQFTSTLIPPTGSRISNITSIVIPDADLHITLANRLLTAGTPISLTVSNRGGADTSAGYSAWLRDASGITVQTITGTLATIQGGGGSGSFAFPVPDGAVSGSYALGGVVTNTQAGLIRPFTILVAVDGAEAAITAQTQPIINAQGQPVTATAQVSNTGGIALNNATVKLAVDAPPDWTWFTHRPGQHGPGGGTSGIVSDSAGIKWMLTQRGINAFDDGGTPFNGSDDQWQVFDTLYGVPRPYAFGIFAAAAGHKWISSGQGAPDRLSVLDDGGTPFDVSDDQWLHYTSADGPIGNVLAQDGSGYLWMNHAGGGVSVLDPGADPMSKNDDRWAAFSTADGLANNNVSIIRVDASGYKWFATQNGASAMDDGGDPFDGTSDTWHSFYVGSGLPDNWLKGMEIDGNGRVWFAGGGISFAYDLILGVLDTGVSPVDGTGDTFFTFAPSTSSLYGIIGGFSLDGNGRAWFGLPNGKTGILDPGTDPFSSADDTWGSVINPYYYGGPPMIPAGGSAAWLGSGYGLMLFDHGGDPFDDTDDVWQFFNRDAGIGNYNVSAIAPGEAGMTWIGSESNGPLGLRVLDPSGTPTDPTDDQWMSFYTADGLPSDGVSAIALEGTGRVWVVAFRAAVLDHSGTPFDKADDAWQTFTEADIALGGVYDLAIDNNNRKWFAGWSSGNTHGLVVLDDGGTPISKTDDLTMTFPIAGMTSNEVNAVAIDQNGVKWGVTWAEAAALDDNGTPFNTGDDVTQVFPLYTANHYPSDVAVDGQNNIWIAFNGNSGGVGVLDYNGTLTNTADDTWRFFYSFNGLVDNWVIGVAVDGRGDKWFATNGGLSRLDDGGDPFDGLNDTWESFTTVLGLGINPSPEVDVVAVGGDGNIWAGTWDNGASVGVWQGAAVWSTQQPIASLPAAGATQVITGVSGLANAGRYLLRGEFINDLGQTMATDRTPFYIVSGQTLLTLEAAPDPVRPGGTITLTGALVNNGVSLLTNQVVTLYQDGALIHSEGPFDLAAGSSHPYTVTTTAPAAGSSSGFSAVSGGLNIELNVVVGRPMIVASASVPSVVGSDPFSVTISLTNSGPTAGHVQISFNNQQQALAVLPGETAHIQVTAQVCADSALPVTLTGDLTQTLNVPVTFGQSLDAAFMPQPVYPPRALAIPHTVTGTGQLDIAFTAAITVQNSQSAVAGSQFDTYLIASDIITGSSPFDLPAGDYNLLYSLGAGSCVFASGQESFSVAPANSAAISLTAGGPGPMLPITATLTNRGSGDLTGELQLGTDYGYQATQPVSLTVGASGIFTFAVDVMPAAAGIHTATVTAVTGAGINLGQAGQTFSVLGPVMNMTALPNQITLPVSQTITLTFGVSNQGDQDGQAEFRFAFGDIEDETQVRRISSGVTEQFDVAFFVPPEFEAKDYLATYELNGQQGELLFTIQGISLTVTATAGQTAYQEGESAQLELIVTNNLTTTEPGLYALVRLGGLALTRPFTLTTTPVQLTFPLTATFGSGGLVFYGLYHQGTQRGIHLNTFRLPQQQGAVTVLLDRQVYVPGDGVQATIVTTAAGQLELSAPGYTATRPLSGSSSSFTFTLPALMSRGSYTVNYRLTGCSCDEEGRIYQASFDVDGPLVRVTDARLDRHDYAQGDPVSARLIVSTDRAVSGVLRTEIIYPGNQAGAMVSQAGAAQAIASQAIISRAITLSDGPANVVTATAVITGTQAGLHFLRYEIVDAADDTLVYAAGIEAFDLGQASLIGVSTDRFNYADAADPVTVTLHLFASGSVSGSLSLALDGGATQVQMVDVPAGWQTVVVPLSGPIDPGRRLLTATLSNGGFSSQVQTTFDYGSDLPELYPGAPWIEAGGVLTRSLMSLVTYDGDSASPPTTVRFYQGDPSSAGSLIGSIPLPGVNSGQSTPVSVVWDIQGQGGDHDIHVVVEPVAEFDQANNTAHRTLSLPTLEASLLLTPASITAGSEISVAVRLLNLKGAISLPVTPSIEIVEPGGSTVFSYTWSVLLAGGEERTLVVNWASGTAAPGGYLVKLAAGTADGIYQANTFFTLEAVVRYEVYLPAVLRASTSQTEFRQPGRRERSSSGGEASQLPSKFGGAAVMLPVILGTWMAACLSRRK